MLVFAWLLLMLVSMTLNVIAFNEAQSKTEIVIYALGFLFCLISFLSALLHKDE